MAKGSEAITFRCHACGLTLVHYAPMERHLDTEHWPGGRIEVLIPRKPD